MNLLQKIVIIVFWILVILLTSYFVKKSNANKEELSRKIVHIGTGPVIILAWWFSIPKMLALTFASFITICLAINYKFKLFNVIEDISRKSFGTIAYGISITLLITFLWPENAPAVCLGVLAMAFGDGLAGLIGKGINSPNWLILGQKKSLVGTLTITIIVGILSVIIASIIRVSLPLSHIIILSILSAILEQISPYGIDNITVPIGVSYAWVFLIGN